MSIPVEHPSRGPSQLDIPSSPGASSGPPGAASAPDKSPISPWWVRITHWFNALGVVLMVLSGWRIYDASPIFAGFTFPPQFTIGGWLGGALQWHFFAMWIVFVSFLLYFAGNLFSGRLFRKFFPVTPKAVAVDLGKALTGKLGHDDLRHFNAVQKLAYLSVMVALIVVVLSGLAIWKSVQFSVLRDLMGGYDTARIVHFCAMAFIVLFVVVHVVMVALVPRSLLVMLRGR